MSIQTSSFNNFPMLEREDSLPVAVIHSDDRLSPQASRILSLVAGIRNSK